MLWPVLLRGSCLANQTTENGWLWLAEDLCWNTPTCVMALNPPWPCEVELVTDFILWWPTEVQRSEVISSKLKTINGWPGPGPRPVELSYPILSSKQGISVIFMATLTTWPYPPEGQWWKEAWSKVKDSPRDGDEDRDEDGEGTEIGMGKETGMMRMGTEMVMQCEMGRLIHATNLPHLTQPPDSHVVFATNVLRNLVFYLSGSLFG